MKNNNVKNEIASIILASSIFAGMSTLVVSTLNDSDSYSSNQVDVSYASKTSHKNVKQDVGQVFNTATPYSNYSKKENNLSKSIQAKKITLMPVKKQNNEFAEKSSVDNISKVTPSKQQSSNSNQNKKIFREMSKADRFILYRIVEAEATNGDKQSKKNVTHVILNRLKSNKFPKTISGIVFQKHQFSPISDGRYYGVTIKESTKQAVIEAYEEGDTTGGALYFANMSCVSNVNTRRWFNSMTYLFKDSIGHSFYK